MDKQCGSVNHNESREGQYLIDDDNEGEIPENNVVLINTMKNGDTVFVTD